MSKKLMSALKKVVSKSKAEAYLTQEELKEFLTYLKKNSIFKQMKTDYEKIQNELIKEFQLNKDNASSLINYAIHADK